MSDYEYKWAIRPFSWRWNILRWPNGDVYYWIGPFRWQIHTLERDRDAKTP